MAANADLARTVRTYGNWRRPASAGIMGLGTLGTMFLLGSLIIIVFVVMIGGMLRGAIAAAFLGIVLVGVLTKDKHGKSAMSKIGVRMLWWKARMLGAHLYRSGPLGRAAWGRYQLPGIAAPLRLSEHKDSYGRPFALLHMPSANHFTCVIASEPDGAALVDMEQVDSWVAEWGHWLANLGDEAGMVAASVTVETAPDTGTRLTREVMGQIDEEAPEFAQRVLLETVEAYPHGSSTVRAFVALTFSPGKEKKSTPEEMGREIATHIPGLTQSLAGTGAGAARPMDAQELCEVVLTAYDPAAAVLIEEAKAVGETPEISWADVGPTAHQAGWDKLRHDSALSVSWTMTSAPRGNVQSSILTRLLTPHGDIARKRVTMLYRPLDPARTAAIVEADLRAAQFRATSNAKPTARDLMESRSAQATASEEAAGAGLVNFGMIVTATVDDLDKEADARAAIMNLAAASRLRLRPAYGAQDSTFAASLPLGIVLPAHLRIPVEIREQM
ncbi:SCO6880 family protein [Nocardiopsis ganjiahuensis]|uniref:SCO6880 family protein n=1 Tax=Nocardiopsis ganjiahuensis TaxID=239984 RepID=UPI000344A224|nr:SCO6880 family protein [Nocardiopsis ganjiahuensis]